MGRVFTPEQITSHEIPGTNDHELAGRFVLQSLFEPADLWENRDEGVQVLNLDAADKYFGLYGGMVYGSTALGCPNIRSDVDVLITYSPNYAHKVIPTIRDVFKAAEEQFHVLVEHNLLYFDALHSPLENNIDPLFADHLIKIQDQDDPRWSYNWPVDGLRNSGTNKNIDQQYVRALAIRYCSGKTRHFARAMADYRGEIDYHALQRAFEIPAALGRKVVAATYGVEHVDQSLLQRKDRVVQLLIDKLADTYTEYLDEPGKKLRMLSDMDTEYNKLLSSAIEGSVDVKYYEEWIKNQYLIFLRLAHEVSNSWTEILRLNLDKRKTELESLSTMPEPEVLDYY